MALTPQQINFGNEPLQTASNPVTVTLTNEGSAALSITSITASGDFQQTNTCGTSVPGGEAPAPSRLLLRPPRWGCKPIKSPLPTTRAAG